MVEALSQRSKRYADASLEAIVSFARDSWKFWLVGGVGVAALAMGQNQAALDETPIVRDFIRLAGEHPYTLKSSINMAIYGAVHSITEKMCYRRPVDRWVLAAALAYGAMTGPVEHELFRGIAELVPGTDMFSALGRTLLFNPLYVNLVHIPAYVTSMNLGKAVSNGKLREFSQRLRSREYWEGVYSSGLRMNREISKKWFPWQFYVLGFAPQELKVTLGNLVGAFAKGEVAYRHSQKPSQS